MLLAVWHERAQARPWGVGENPAALLGEGSGIFCSEAQVLSVHEEMAVWTSAVTCAGDA